VHCTGVVSGRAQYTVRSENGKHFRGAQQQYQYQRAHSEHALPNVRTRAGACRWAHGVTHGPCDTRLGELVVRLNQTGD
jgi:hypothetical protein